MGHEAVWSDLLVELDALEACYGDELVIDEGKAISMLLVPTLQQHETYVQCQLVLTLDGQYPAAAAPGIVLQDVRGLGCSRLAALEEHLASEASQLLGEMMLGQLFESAKDWLIENNWPEGPCIFCLEDLSSHTENSSSQPAQACMRLPCFHAFHQSCFSSWWCWQQQSLTEQQQQLEQKTGATAAATLVQEQLPAKEGDVFQLSCPTCRAAFCLQQHVPHMQQQLQQLQRQKDASSSSGGNSSSCSSNSSSRLTAAELASFRDVQKRHAALFAAQQQRNGIITDTNYSIQDWDPAAAAAAAGRNNSSSSSGSSSSGSSSSRSSSSGSTSANVYAASGVPQGSRGSGRGSRGRGWGNGSGGGGRGGQQQQQRRSGGDASTSSNAAGSRQVLAEGSQHQQKQQRQLHSTEQRSQHGSGAGRGGGRGRGRGSNAPPKQQLSRPLSQ